MQLLRYFRVLLAVGLMALLHACATPLAPPEQRLAKIDQLANDIQQLSPSIPPEEAYEFAKVAVEASAELGRKYEVVFAPWLHNASIVTGLKDRGLCYEYARDLYDSLKYVESEHLTMYFVKANKGKLNEHHALVVSAKDAGWDHGVLLDAWRGSGNLYFASPTTDKYPWMLENRDASFVTADNSR